MSPSQDLSLPKLKVTSANLSSHKVRVKLESLELWQRFNFPSKFIWFQFVFIYFGSVNLACSQHSSTTVNIFGGKM